MGEDTLHELIKDLITAIESYESLNDEGLKQAMFPDDLILAIHNHLGNAYQLIGSAEEAFNGAEQTIAYRSAQNELDALSNNLFSAQQTGLIGEASFRSLDNKIRNIKGLISDFIDPEYIS